jgi:dolichyl-phosphate-mannose--protein O-mannosyl transferase
MVILTAVLGGLFAFLFLAAGVERPRTPCVDELSYVPVARALLHGTVPALPSQLPGWHHPPLGSYLISFGITLAGDNPLGWRLASIVFGALTLVAIFLWSYLLVRNYRLALAAMLLTAFNNFWFVISRLAMLDVFCFAFAMWGVVGATAAFSLEARVGFRRVCLLFSGVMFGLSMACKWIAVDTLAVMFAVVVVLFLGAIIPAITPNENFAEAARKARSVGWITLVLGILVAPALAYIATILAEFREAHYAVSLKSILDFHVAIYRVSKSFPGLASIRAPWYSWPLRTSPMRGLSYLLGNFVVMWSGLVALLICLVRLRKGFRLAEIVVVLLYAANLLQWAITPIKTPIYYYYYPAAMFLGPAIVVALHQSGANRVRTGRICFFLVLGAAVFFMYCYPRMAYLEAPWDCMFGCWN